MIDPATGEFSGNVWGENIGWITFRSIGAVAFRVTTSWSDNLVQKGDINADGDINLADAILALQVATGIEPSATVYKEADVNGDGKIGIEEVIYILQKVSKVR